MVPDSQFNLSTNVEFLAKAELSPFDPELFCPIEKRQVREALIREYVDVRKLALVASGLGAKGFTSL